MELKSLDGQQITKDRVCSNRTFMELKYYDYAISRLWYVVLIVPLWN